MTSGLSPSPSQGGVLEQIRARALGLSWYHTIDLGNGIVTPGAYDHRPYLRYYGLPKNLSGKTALDIGAASGYFSFELERRGASVTATDLPEWMAHDFGPRYQPDQTPEQARQYLREPFDFAKEVLGSQVVKREMTVYEISPQTIGLFDLVFCGSVLLHLTDPMRALFHIQSVTRGTAIIATMISRDPGSEPVAEFVGHHRGDAWWIPNCAALEAMVQSAGFKGWNWVSDFELKYADGSPGPYHGVIRAWNEPNDLEWDSPLAQKSIQPPADNPPEAEIVRLSALVRAYEQRRSVRWANALARIKRRS